MSRCQITILGSSSGMPSPIRFCSSIFFQTENLNFILDCGEGTSFSLLRNKIDPELIDSIFISHSHSDHLGGLLLLIQMMHNLRRRTPLSVYLPKEAISGVRSFLDTCYLFPDKLSLKLNLHPITHYFAFQDDGISILAYLNRHLAGNQKMIDELRVPNKMQSFCFILDVHGKKIVYSGDIESSDDLRDIIEDADLLITECFHPKMEKLISLILEKRVKSTIFTHIPPELEGKEKDMVIEAQKMGLENLVIAYDGLVTEV
jgi:ribonuclease BN (tRNA processing enzyme)